MSIPAIILLVLLALVSILLVLIVLVQNEEGEGLGGLFGGSSTAFGPRSGNILTKITSVLAVIFFGGALIFSLLLGSGASETELDETKGATLEGETFTEKVESLGDEKLLPEANETTDTDPAVE